MKNKYHKVDDKWVAKSALVKFIKSVLGLGDADTEVEAEPMPDLGELAKALECRIVAKDEARRDVYCVVYEPNAVNGLDAQGEWAGPDEIRKAAHGFLREYRRHALTHRAQTNPAITTVESFLAPCDFVLKGLDGREEKVVKDSWMIGMHIDDDGAWNAVQRGEVSGVSMLGKARRRARAPEVINAG